MGRFSPTKCTHYECTRYSKFYGPTEAHPWALWAPWTQVRQAPNSRAGLTASKGSNVPNSKTQEDHASKCPATSSISHFSGALGKPDSPRIPPGLAAPIFKHRPVCGRGHSFHGITVLLQQRGTGKVALP